MNSCGPVPRDSIGQTFYIIFKTKVLSSNEKICEKAPMTYIESPVGRVKDISLFLIENFQGWVLGPEGAKTAYLNRAFI